jgi:putative salt-induced outer membrane protein
LLKKDAATSGKTDVTTEGFAAVVKPGEENDTTQFEVSAGSLISAGNTESFAFTSASRFKLRRTIHQFGSDAAVNVARSAPASDSGMRTTVENFQGRVRYDLFFADKLAGFTAVSARRDRFQGLDLRLNISPGLAYYFIDAPSHQLSGELGYDFQYDVRREETINEAFVDGTVVDKTEARHNARSMVSYSNQINAAVSFDTALEYLQSVQKSEQWRLNYTAGLSSSISGRFSLATTFSLRYDNAPLPGVEELDLVNAVSLVVSLL